MTTPVDTLIADARKYTSGTLSDATKAINDALAALRQLGGSAAASSSASLIAPSVNGLVPVDPPPPLGHEAAPYYSGPYYQKPSFGAQKPLLKAAPYYVRPTEPGTPPEMYDPKPQDKPQGPAADVTLLQNAPNPNPADYKIQDFPDLLAEIKGITPPEIASITIPAAPSYTLPSFDGVKPEAPGDAPSNLDATLRAAFMDAGTTMRTLAENQVDAYIERQFPQFRSGMAAIESRLQTYLAGGSALKPEVETALFQRSLDKNESEYRREYQNAMSQGARAGFTIPSVTLLNQAQDIDRGRRNNNARAATEILIKQAELEQSNLQFAVTASANLRQVAVTASIAYLQSLVAINGQAVDYARSTVDVIVKAYDVAVRKCEIQARIYEAQANIYEAQIKGAMSVLEAYNATVKGLEAQANVNKAQVDMYRARIESVQSAAAAIRAQADVVVAQANIERTLADIYQTKVQAYAAQVNARTAEWQGFTAATQGESARVSASAERARAYQAEVQAYAESVRAKTLEIESIIKMNQVLVQQYATEIEAYRAEIQGEADSAKAYIDGYIAQVKAFEAESQATTERSKAAIAYYEMKLRSTIADANLAVERARLWQQLDITRATGMADVSSHAAQIYASTAQAALSGMNSLASSTETVTG